MKRILIFFITAVFICSCKSEPDKIIGIKIYDYNGDYEQLASQWSKMGINTAFVSTTLAADKSFRKLLKSRDIRVFVIFPVFFNPEILKKDSTLYAITNSGRKAREDWVEFVCPSRMNYRRALINQISEQIGSLDPDGVSIDFIREFVYWEKIYPDRDYNTIERACFCDSCIAGFVQKQHVTIPDSCRTISEKAYWIEKNYLSEWNGYRCDLITSMVKDLSEGARKMKKGILINLHIVPWRKDDFGGAGINIAGQDIKKMSHYADFISPMCYSQMIDRDAIWISDVVKNMDKLASGMVLPSIQVYPYYIDRKLTAEDFRQCLDESLKPPSRGVVFFSWPLFEKDSSRMGIVKETISRL